MLGFARTPGGISMGRLGNANQLPALNFFVPPLPPGQYRVAAIARQATTQAQAVSNWVSLQIIPANAAWIRNTIAVCVATLEGPAAGAEGYKAQQEAAEQLSFLDVPEAWAASLDLLPKSEGVLLTGLLVGHPQVRVCELMGDRVAAPKQSVSTSYLYRLSEVCAAAHLPPPPVKPAVRPLAGVISAAPPQHPVAPPDPEMMAWAGKHHAYTEGVMNDAAARLAASLDAKQGSAKWDAIATLLQRISQVRVNRPPEPDPAWIPQLSRAFVQNYASLDVPRRQYLLDMYASTIESPDVAPLLESVLDQWKPGDYYEPPQSAIRSLVRIDPARGRARILAELSKDKTWLQTDSLELLPPSAVRPMDDALIDALARAQRPGGWNVQLSMAAIARYATPKALPRIRAIYESQQTPCQPELVAYFVRVDPAYADRIFHSHPWDMHAEPPPCTLQIFERTSRLAMGPPLEKYLAAYLMHGDVHIKSTAARILQRYGTAAAAPALWDALRYFHEYWKGKDAELEKSGENLNLESELRNAIANGRGWLVMEPDLHLIEALCTSGRCVQETRQNLALFTEPLRIDISMGGPYGAVGSVAQYFGLESVAAVEAKLAQYPRGTHFTLRAPGNLANELRRFALEKGLSVTTL